MNKVDGRTETEWGSGTLSALPLFFLEPLPQFFKIDTAKSPKTAVHAVHSVQLQVVSISLEV